MGAIRVHHTGTTDVRWDGPANEANLRDDGTPDYYRAAFAWQDENATKKSDFKFIHHEVSSAGKVGDASVRACVAGIAILNGARGGTKIPDADREGVYRHLATHIKDSGAKPPELKSMTNQRKVLDLNLQLKALGHDGTFTGDLSVYDFVDYGGDATEKGCFTKTLKESGGRVPMLWQHDMHRPIGAMELTDGDTALEVKGILNMDVPDAKIAHSMMRFNKANGITTGLSMGYIPVKDQVKDGVRYLQEVKLLEGSVVTLAANRLCAISDVKQRGALRSPERKSFSEELEEAQVSSLFYQIVNALWSELANCVYGDDGDDQDKVSAGCAQAFTDASSAFADYIKRRFAMLASDTDGDAQYMSFPETAVAQKAIANLETLVQALKAKSRATSTEAGAAATPGAANQPNEPGAAHSDELTPEQKLRIRQFTKEAVQDGSR